MAMWYYPGKLLSTVTFESKLIPSSISTFPNDSISDTEAPLKAIQLVHPNSNDQS
jgi:hypothetical protein